MHREAAWRGGTVTNTSPTSGGKNGMVIARLTKPAFSRANRWWRTSNGKETTPFGALTKCRNVRGRGFTSTTTDGPNMFRHPLMGAGPITFLPCAISELPLKLRSRPMTKKIFVERRPEEKDYAVRRPNSERASATAPTQREAIERARELNPDGPVLVERVRTTNAGKPDKWRKS